MPRDRTPQVLFHDRPAHGSLRELVVDTHGQGAKGKAASTTLAGQHSPRRVRMTGERLWHHWLTPWYLATCDETALYPEVDGTTSCGWWSCGGRSAAAVEGAAMTAPLHAGLCTRLMSMSEAVSGLPLRSGLLRLSSFGGVDFGLSGYEDDA